MDYVKCVGMNSEGKGLWEYTDCNIEQYFICKKPGLIPPEDEEDSNIGIGTRRNEDNDSKYCQVYKSKGII